MSITFTCEVCDGKIVFDDNDELALNACVCKDNPIEIVEYTDEDEEFEWLSYTYSCGCCRCCGCTCE